MEIKKQYDVNVLAKKLRKRVEISNGSDTRFVKIDLITTVEVLDVLEEIGRMEMEHGRKKANPAVTVIDRLQPGLPVKFMGKKAPESMKNGCEECDKDVKPECFGKYSTESWDHDCDECSHVSKCCEEDTRERISKQRNNDGQEVN